MGPGSQERITSMIKIEGLTILLKSFAISNLNIRIEEGQFHFLLGPTGSGKTLILESIIGLRKPHRGKILIGEREVQGLPPERREISYVPQDLALFPHLRVQENILFGIRARNLRTVEYEDHIRSLVRVMKVDHLLQRYPGRLSGGEKKRIALLRALAPKPKLLLLDEPLSGLDPSIKIEIQHLLKTLHASFHPTTLCVTHDFDEAYFLGDEITICIDGQVKQVGGKDDVFLRPTSREVAQFLGARNLYRATVLDKEDDRWILAINGLRLSVPGRLYRGPVPSGREVNLFIRSEEVMIIREGKSVKDTLKNNILDGDIIDIADRGRHYVVNFQTREGNIPFEISIPSYVFRNLNLSPGMEARVALRDESLWVMD